MRTNLLSTSLFVVTSLLAVRGEAAEVFALRADLDELWVIDTATFQATPIGSFSRVDPNETIDALAYDAATGRLFGLSSGFFSGHLVEFDVATGAASALFPLNGPTTSLGCSFDPTTNRVWWLNTGGFFPAPQVYYANPFTQAQGSTGNVGDFTQWFAGMAMTDTGDAYALETNSKSLYFIDENSPLGGGAQSIGPLGAIDLQNGASLTLDGSLAAGLLAYSTGDHALYRIDAATGQTTLDHSFGGGIPRFRAIAGKPCGGEITPYGAGCLGSGGFVPSLSVTGCPAPGSAITIGIGNGLGGASALLVVGTQQASVPISPACHLLTFPLAPLSVFVGLGGAGPGNGATAFGAPLPPTVPGGITFQLQAFVLDGGVPLGAAGTNAVEIMLGN
jgi:hypothetical protein